MTSLFCCRRRQEKTGQTSSPALKEEGRSHAPARNAEENANFLSRFFVAWMIEPLSIARNKKDLRVEDFGPPAKCDQVDEIYTKLTRYFEEENHNLFRALARLVTYRVLFLGFVLTVLQAAANIAVPFLTKAILNSLTGQIPLTTGELWGVTVGMILCPLIGALCQAHVLLLSRRASLHMFLGLTQLIFVKSLTKSDISIGRATNLISNDAGVAIERSVQMLFPLLVSPIQLAILLWLLYDQLGVSVFAGIGTIFVILPFNVFIFSRISLFNGRIMKAADFRLKLINEFLSAVRIVKAYAWEEPLLKKIELAREKELNFIGKHAVTLNVGLGLVFVQLANVMQLVVMWTYYGTGGVFSPVIIFPAVQFFALIQSPLASLPNSVSSTIQTRVAIRRINAFLNEPDLEYHQDDQRFVKIDTPVPGEVLIDVQNASFAWRESQDQENKRAPFVLHNITLQLKRGELVAVVSKLGGGKTSFIKALLGEMTKQSGRVMQRGTVAFAQQDPFIMNGTLRDNILFGSEFEEDRYFQVIDQCALTSDLMMFKGGDQIQIGEKGINLSGGQMARLALARAIYSKADVVLLDDPLSAVDSHVGDKLFETFRTSSLLRNRLTVLVTNQIHRLKSVDRIVSFAPGGIFVGCDTYDEFSNRQLDVGDEDQEDTEMKEEPAEKKLAENGSGSSSFRGNEQDILEREKGGIALAKQASLKSMEETVENLFEAEHTRSGSMSWKVFGIYARSAGIWVTLLAAGTCAAYMILPSMGQIVMSHLTNAQMNCMLQGQEKCDDSTILMYLGWYTFTVGMSLILCVVSGIMMALLRVRSARKLHSTLLEAISAASTAMYDSTPMGRISNRFAKDMAMIDTLLSQFFMWVCLTGSIVIGAVISVAVATQGVFLGIVVPVFLAFFLLFRFQRVGGAAIHRIEGTTRAPVYSLFAETLTGRHTIRAFQQQERFKNMSAGYLARNSVPYYLGRTGLPAFLTTFLNIIGFFSTAAVSIFVVFGNIVSASDAGLALSSISAIVATLYFCVFILQDFELQLSAVERVDVFIKSIQDWEKPWYCPDVDPKGDWPSNGYIQLKDMSVGYRKGPDVLKHLTLDVKPQEKIGVVGRTGSGKSTLLKVLLRLCEARSGTILIDGVDINQIGLTVLRSNIGIIPQEPVMFFETIRYNLDPFSRYSDSEIYSVLDLVGLGDFIRGMSLDYVVSESGANFSQGQRQLLCVVRALLRKTKILLLDEPSASIDHDSDQILQKTIRTAFKQCTTLTVAHRLISIADCDKVLVLAKGEIVEYDAPYVLLNNPEGYFRGMVNVLEESEQKLCEEMAKSAYTQHQNGNGTTV